MTRDMNGLQTALKKCRAQRLLVDTKTGTILGYTDIQGRSSEPRPQVLAAIAGSRVAIFTIGEYLRITRDDSERTEEKKRAMTASEWFKTIDNDGLNRMLLSCNAGRDPKITEFLTK